jgi:hypothetical protein
MTNRKHAPKVRVANELWGQVEEESKTELARQLGPTLYAARVGNAIKIGWTSDIADRAHHFPGGLRSLLALKRGSLADERAIHERLIPYRIGMKHEHYHPAPEVLAVVNEMRSALHLPPIE